MKDGGAVRNSVELTILIVTTWKNAMFNKIETLDLGLHCALDFLEQLQFDEAIIKFKECLEKAKKSGTIKIQLFCYYGLAEVILWQNNLIQSNDYYQYAQETLEQLEKQNILLVEEFWLWSNRLCELREEIEEAEFLIFEPNVVSDWVSESSGQSSTDIFSTTSQITSKVEEKKEQNIYCGNVEGAKKLILPRKDDPISKHVDDIRDIKIDHANRKNETTYPVGSSQNQTMESFGLSESQGKDINEINSIFQKALYDFYMEKIQVQHLFKETLINIEDLNINFLLKQCEIERAYFSDIPAEKTCDEGILIHDTLSAIYPTITAKNLFIGNLSIAIKENRAVDEEEFERFPSRWNQVLNVSKKENRLCHINKVLIRGDTTIGKSGLCDYLVYQWTIGKLWQQTQQRQFEWLLWIPLRELSIYATKVKKHASIVGFLSQQLKLSENIVKSILDDNKKIRYILDGYDEISHLPKSNLNHTGHPVWPLINLLEKMPQWIMTSQSHRVEALPKANRVVEVMGFSGKDIHSYIKKYFEQGEEKSPESGEQLIAYLENNLTVWRVAHIPVQLEIICFAWQQKYREQLMQIKNVTLTMLYTCLNQHLLHYYLTKKNIQGNRHYCETLQFGVLPANLKKKMSAFAAVALKGLMNQELFVSPIVISQTFSRFGYGFDDLQEIADIGLLKEVGNTIDEYKHYYFLHLAFQVYYAALHIVETFTGEVTWCLEDLPLEEHQERIYPTVEDFIRRHKYDIYYETVWWFVSGLLSEQSQLHTKRFFDLLQEAPYDILGLRRTVLMVRLLEECMTRNGELGLSIKDYNTLIEATRKYTKKIVSSESEKLKGCKASLARNLALSPRLEKEGQLLVLGKSKQFSSQNVINFHKLLGLNGVVLRQDVIDKLIQISKENTLSRPRSYSYAVYEALGYQAHLEDVRKALIHDLLNDKQSYIRGKAAQALKSQIHLKEVRIALLTALFNRADKVSKYDNMDKDLLCRCMCLTPYAHVRDTVAEILASQTDLETPLLNVLHNLNLLLNEMQHHQLAAEFLQSKIHLEIVDLLLNDNVPPAKKAVTVLEVLQSKIYLENIRKYIEDAIKTVIYAFVNDTNAGLRKKVLAALVDQVYFEDVRKSVLNVFLNEPNDTLRKGAFNVLADQVHFEDVRRAFISVLFNHNESCVLICKKGLDFADYFKGRKHGIYLYREGTSEEIHLCFIRGNMSPQYGLDEKLNLTKLAKGNKQSEEILKSIVWPEVSDINVYDDRLMKFITSFIAPYSSPTDPLIRDIISALAPKPKDLAAYAPQSKSHVEEVGVVAEVRNNPDVIRKEILYDILYGCIYARMRAHDAIKSDPDQEGLCKFLLDAINNEQDKDNRKRIEKILINLPIPILLTCYKTSSKKFKPMISKPVINQCISKVLSFCLEKNMQKGELSLYLDNLCFNLAKEEAEPFIQTIKQFCKKFGIPFDSAYPHKSSHLSTWGIFGTLGKSNSSNHSASEDSRQIRP